MKWIEDRIENLSTTAFARDYHMTGELAATQGRPHHRACAVHVLADHGAFDACADPTKFPAGLFSHLHRLVRHPGGALRASMASTPTRRRAASPIAARSG